MLGAAMILAACEGSPHVAVDLRTDYLPRLEFDSIVVAIDGGEVRTARPEDGADYVGGARVADLPIGAGSRALTLRLERAGVEVARRTVLVEVERSVAVTVVLTRDCEDVTCDAPTATAQACLGGRCVDATCTPENPIACPGSACTTSAECAAGLSPCAVSRCEEGTCFVGVDLDRCGEGEACHPIVGCLAPGAPVALNGSAAAYGAEAEVRLDALDLEGDPLTYHVVGAPSLGTLSGEPPRLRYRPTALGVDRIVFVVSDGTSLSNVAEVSIANTRPPNAYETQSARPLTACGVLSEPGTYAVQTEITAAGDCLVVSAPDVVVLGPGAIRGDGSGVGVALDAPGGVVAGLRIEDFAQGVLMRAVGGTVASNLFARCGDVAVVAQGAEHADITSNSIESDRGMGILVTSRSNQALVAGNRVSAIAGPGIHFYDDSADCTAFGNRVSTDGTGISCDRCQRLNAVGNELNAAVGVRMVLAGVSATLAANRITTSADALIYEHWGGCNDNVLSNNDVLASMSDLRFEPGSPHSGMIVRNHRSDPAREVVESGSSYSRRWLLVARVERAGAPVSGAAIALHRPGGAREPAVTGADGFAPVFEVEEYSQSGSTRTPQTGYELEGPGGDRVPLDATRSQVVVLEAP